MKLRNKKTGEIKDIQLGNHNDPSDGIVVVYSKNGEPREPHDQYSSLAELNEEWEDYEEPKEYWYINDIGEVEVIEEDESEETEDAKQIGNYFSSKEEAEKAVEKLKAWKRLKDDGFKFDGWFRRGNGADIIYCDFGIADTSLLNLLFRGEE